MDILLKISAESYSVIAFVMVGAACALHLISRVLTGEASKIIGYVNVFLHILLFGVIVLSEMAIDLAMLLYMVSLFVYTLTCFVKYEREGKR